MPLAPNARAVTAASFAAAQRAQFARDVREGLTREGQKELPSKYFYDAVGSALFEAITLLPEYGLTRAEQRILTAHAADITERAGSPATVVELGSGSGKKTRLILDALARHRHVTYHPIELSRKALEMCERELDGVDALRVIGYQSEYLEGLRQIAERRRDQSEPGRLLVLFLGSSIGNFDHNSAERFLTDIRLVLLPGDALLLGVDLEKSESRMTLAYDDSAGVTAAFNLNLLARINRELGADFDLRRFRHDVRYNREGHRIEMHLRSSAAQTVAVPEAGCTARFEPGETIWTESCHKYTSDAVTAMAARAGLRQKAAWVDEEWSFADCLFVPGEQ